MNPSRLAVSLFTCAALAAGPAAHAEDTPAAPQVTADTAAPASDLTDEILYNFLLAEIAGQRGQFGIATDFYLQLARATRDPVLVQRATEVAIFSRRPQQALEAARIWQEIDPQSPQANQASALLLISAGKLDEATASMSRILAGSSPEQRAQWFLNLPALLGKTADKQAALQLTETLAQPYGDMAEAHFALAHAYAGTGRAAAALDAIRMAQKLRPDWEQAVLLEARLLQTADPAAALQRLQTFLDSNPQASEARLAYAKLLARNNQFEQARQQFSLLQERFPGNADLMVARALIEFQLGQHEETRKLLLAALEAGYTDRDAVHFYLGQNEEARQQLAAAKGWYKQVEAGDFLWDTRLRLANIQAHDGEISAARSTLHSLKPADSQQRVQLIQAEAQLLSEARQYQTAFDVLQSGLRKQPEQPDLLYDQAMVAEKLGRLDILESNLRKLIKSKPDNAQVYNALGYTLADRTNRLTEAHELLSKALQLAPNDPFILDSMGWLHYRQGKFDDAISYLQRAYSTRPDPEIAAHLGEALWHNGKQQEARAVWQSALGRHPQHEALLGVVRKYTH